MAFVIVIDETSNRAEWKIRIHIADPKYWDEGFIVVLTCRLVKKIGCLLGFSLGSFCAISSHPYLFQILELKKLNFFIFKV